MGYKKKTSVCLIYPGISWTGFDSFGQKGGESCFIHHGLGSIAAVLTKEGVGVEYVDFRKLKGWDEVRRVISKSGAKYFGITATTVDFDIAKKTALLIKKLKPKSNVIIGGVHATIRPQEAMAWGYFDWVVTGEGEGAILEILKGKTKKRLVVGKAYNLESIPPIDRDLFDHRGGEMRTPFVDDLPVPFATFMSSRGCPFNCSFCQPAERMIFAGKVRFRTMKEFVSEIIEVKKKYGLASFLIHDDLFLVNRDRMEEFCRLYEDSGVGAEFMCQARADLIVKYEKQMEQLREAGLRGVMIGFESGSQRVLDLLNKQVKVEQNIEAAKICKKLGIKIWANFMLGIPTETYGEMYKTLKMIDKIKPEYYSPSLFTPYPETGLYDLCLKEEKLIFKEYSQYRRSLGGRKIKGFNYWFIRAMLFWYLPLNQKIASIKAVIS